MIEFLDPINVKVKKLLNRLTEARANNLDNCNSPISDCAQTDDPRFNLLNRLDVLLSSRLAAADYVASPIKAIQRGSFSFAPGSSGTITINSVNVNKAMVLVSCRNGFYHYYYSASVDYSFATHAGVRLSNSTTLSWSSGGGTALATHKGNGICYWEVVEFN